MKKTILLLVGLWLTKSMILGQENNTFLIKGSIQTKDTSAILYLSYHINKKEYVTDSLKPQNGKFKFTGKLYSNPLSASMQMRHKGDILEWWHLADESSFYMENKPLEIEIKDSVKYMKILHSKINNDNKLLRARIKPYEDIFGFYIKKYPGHVIDTTDPGFLRARDSCKVAIEAEKRIRNAFIDSNRNSYIALEAFQSTDLGYSFNPDTAEIHFAPFSADLKNTPLGKEIQDKISIAHKRKAGSKVMDFTQNDTSGNPVKLSDYRGKYVLVDFWASWCAPCRAENPNLVAAYKKLKQNNKDLQIISVSLDENKMGWLNAVHQDSLPWTQVSDLKGFKNEAAVQYGIDAIPQNVLISPDGTILANNLRGTDVYEKLVSYIK